MFTCPRCGSRTYKTTTLRDGTVERSCIGQLKQATVNKLGSHVLQGALPPRACLFVWAPADDARYGVEDEGGAAPT